jgi:uncharacterized protein (TIGR02231 family)
MKRATRIIIAGSILFFLAILDIYANEKYLTGSFGEITVYRDRALVTRTASVDLTAGEHRLVFEPLPSALVNESVRVSGEGTAQVTILGVETQQAYPAEPVQERVREIEKMISELRFSMEMVRSELASLEAERELLKSIRVHSGDQMGREAAVQQPDTRRWESTLDYLRIKLEENYKLALEKRETENDIQRQIDLLEKEKQQIASPGHRNAKRVVVRVRVERSGSLDLNLSYITGGAMWRPQYSARVSDRNDDVILTYNAIITQRTGEDWQNAAIVLSTARPAAGARMPVLSPWFLSERPEIVLREVAETRMEDVVITAARTRAAEPAVSVAEELVASMVFRVPGMQTIPADGSDHHVYINEYRLGGSKEYITTPKLNANAYLKVKTAADVILLPGTVNIFLGNDFVGSSSVGYTAKGEPMDLYLGVDEGIRIERTEVSRNVDEGGFMSRRKRTDLAYRIEIENHKSHPVTISVLDHLPVAQHADIEVRTTNMAPRPLETSEQGIVTWQLDLAPGEKKAINYEFQVRHPAGMSVIGM